MDAETQDLLYLIAEVAIATVALSGITMVLAVSGVKLSQARASQISAQLGMATVVVVFAILPLILNTYKLSNQLLWGAAAGSYLLTVVVINFRRLSRPGSFAQLSSVNGAIISIAASCAMVFLPLSIWSGLPWPYVTQLFVAWIAAMILFLSFIYEILSSKGELIED